MANIDRPNGFRPVKTLSGEGLAGMVRQYEVGDRSADTTNAHGALFVGDPVKLTAGKVFPANSGDTILGVAVAFGDGAMFGEDTYSDIDNQSRPQQSPLTEITGVVGVIPAEGILFEIQTAADLDLLPGSKADISLAAGAAHGSATTGNSTVEMVVASNNDVEVVEQSRDINNDATLANSCHLVQFLLTQHAT